MQGILCLSRANQSAHSARKTLRCRRPKQLARDECSRTRAWTWSRPGAGADVEEAFDRCSVSGLPGKRAPDEVLVERERPGIRVAVHEIDIGGLQVGRRQDDPGEDRRLEVRDV